ncbi:MAG: isoleucine--tRNA ligase [uncultured DHVE6 group euryarchaeote]|nr:MAG: isoleucine--tRNA ligase [uncultured DHVE6 group euryarchaeote]
MSNYNFKKVEPEMKKYWRKINLLKLLQHKNKQGKPYFLLEGPPYANNIPHVGHLRNIYYKDLSTRYAWMTGRSVIFTAGFDTHGLPIENMVEKQLGFKRKQDILDYGISNFTHECKKLADQSIDFWMNLYENYGMWMGWDKEPYLTYKNSYLESSWWMFKQMFKKNQVYRGKKPIHWCPHCETSLAGAEIEQTEKTDPGVYIKFKLKNDNASILVFTTTPWTLPSNVAIAATKNGTYVKVKTTSGNLILAEARLELLESLGIKYKVLQKFKGNKLAGEEYYPLFDIPVQNSLNKNKKARKIYMSIPILKERIAPKTAEKRGIKSKDVFEQFVSVEEGTGFVHMATGHGKTDNEVGKYYGLPELSPLDDSCNFTDDAGKYKGLFVKDADNLIIKDLEKSNSLLHKEKVRHNYPTCWRCKQGLIFKLSNQWFFKTDKIRKKLLAENNKVKWKPEFGRERMNSWLANYDDWNFSRQRFWGIPIPIWINENNPKDMIVIESKKELEKLLGKKLPVNYDLHNVVELTIKNKKGTYKKIPDIFDVWYDSGVVHTAWLGAPLQNKAEFKKHFPVDRISEGLDQVSGWFTSLLFTSVSVFGKAPFKYISMPAFAVDSKGEKMSKSVGNVVWADKGIEDLGADLIRLYYTSNVPPYEMAKFNIGEVKKETFGVINTLWNLHNYLLTEYPFITSKRVTEPEDKWIISKLNSLIKNYHTSFDNFEYQEMGRNISEFIVKDLSRNYIQLVRSRIEEKDSRVGYILLRCITDVLKLLAPISPFVADKIYQNLNVYGLEERSIHLEKLPTSQKREINLQLEEEFELVQSIVSDTLALRDKMKRNLRWPINEVVIVSPSLKVSSVIKNYNNLIKTQVNALNLKNRRSIDNVNYNVKLNFREVGKKHGKKTNEISKALSKLSAEKIISELSKNSLNVKIKSERVKLTNNEVFVERKLPKGLRGISRSRYILYLDATENNEMLTMGYTRELTRKIQDLRKNSRLRKSDKIEVQINSNKKLDINSAEIKKKTNANNINLIIKNPKNPNLVVKNINFLVKIRKN